MYVPSIPSPLPHSTTKHRRRWMAVWSGVWSHRRQTCPSSSFSCHSTSQHSRYEHNQFISVYLLKYTEQTFKGENLREWVENKIFAEKTFTDCSLVSPPKDATLPILQRKFSRIATKPWNLQTFSSSKVSHYTEVYWVGIPRYTCFHRTIGASSQHWWCAAAARQLYIRQPTPGKREGGWLDTYETRACRVLTRPLVDGFALIAAPFEFR